MDRCSLCPGIHNCVSASTPECNDYTGPMFIGEAPGKMEDERQRVFIGKTGQEFNEHYLPILGLRRENVYITNAIKCLPPGPKGKLDMNRQKDVDLLLSCADHHLYPEIASISPTILVPMGAFACYALDPGINLELQHGIPLETSWGTVFPMYHPAGGIHEPKKMLLIRNDFIRLGKYLKGKLRLPVDEHPAPDYQYVNADQLLDEYINCNDYTGALSCDTEVTRHKEPFCLTFTTAPGMGSLIKADDKDALGIFQSMLDRWTGPILFHNWLFDGDVVRAMGLRFPEHLIVDTMVRCFHLGNLPQGLKALAYRLLGMKMQDFMDLVRPYSTPIALEYLRSAQQHEWPKPDEQLVRDESGKWKLYKPQSMSTKLKRFFTDYSKNPSKDVFSMWSDNWEDSHQLIESVMGPWPGLDIRHVPFDKVIHYACRDVDALIRLWPVLEHMRHQVRRKPQEHWGE